MLSGGVFILKNEPEQKDSDKGTKIQNTKTVREQGQGEAAGIWASLPEGSGPNCSEPTWDEAAFLEPGTDWKRTSL